MTAATTATPAIAMVTLVTSEAIRQQNFRMTPEGADRFLVDASNARVYTSRNQFVIAWADGVTLDLVLEILGRGQDTRGKNPKTLGEAIQMRVDYYLCEECPAYVLGMQSASFLELLQEIKDGRRTV